MGETHRVAIIGLDGATFDILEPMIHRGYLPHVAEFYFRGARSDLISTTPPVTAAAWTSFATGLNPGRTGIFDFWNRRGDGWQMRPMASSDLAGRAFWDLAGYFGHRVIVYNYPMLYPAYSVNGTLVGGIGSSLDNRLTYPLELFETLQNLCAGYEVSVDFNSPRYTDRPDLFAEHTLQLLDKHATAIDYLMQNEEWDVFVCVLSVTDFAQHYLWKYIDPSHRDHDQTWAQSGQEAFRQIWQRVDAIVGGIVANSGPATDVILMSDHGFGPEDQTFYVNSWLEKHGYLVRQPTGGMLWRFYPELRQLARTTLGRWFPKSFEILRQRRMAQVRFGSVLSQVDMSKTKAIGLGSTASGTIYINPTSCPDALYEQTREEIRTALQNLGVELRDDIQVEVHFRGEIYTGEKVKWAPDIVFSVNNYRCTVVDAFSNGSVLEKRCWSPNKSGSHRIKGVIMALGPHINPAKLSSVSILDLAPTILFLLDVPLPRDLDGNLVTELISDEYMREHAVRYTDHQADRVMEGYSRQDEEAVAARLQDLGYL